jgi:hypothetical protein
VHGAERWHLGGEAKGRNPLGCGKGQNGVGAGKQRDTGQCVSETVGSETVRH